MQVKYIDTSFDPSLGNKTSIHFENGTKHIYSARANKALSTIFFRVTPYNFELLLLLLLLLLLILNFLHFNIRAPKNLRISVKLADP